MVRSLRFAQITFFVAAVGMATTACATPIYAQRDGYYRDIDRRGYDIGYNEGVRQGQNDARRGRDYSYTRHDQYRDADDGYRREYGDREFYRRSYREGFQVGYAEGFNRYNAVRRYPSSTYPSHPTYPTYPTSPYPSYPGGVAVPRSAYSPAAQIGYRDGLDAGRHDAQDRRPYDPVRVKRYRDGDHDYENRYGSRDEYKREYRAAFEQGYRDGYGRAF